MLAGASSFVFLTALERVTNWRVVHGWLIWLLPAAGLAVGLVSHRMAARGLGRVIGGTAVAVEQARHYTTGVPAAMAPVVLGGALLGHLVGASVGREGAAVQVSSSLTDACGRALRLDAKLRAVLARAAMAGGFGSVFGVPFAGAAFAIGVSRRRTIPTLVASVTAAFAGHWTVIAFGFEHVARPDLDLDISPIVVAKLILAAVCFGLAARWFAWAVPTLRSAFSRSIRWAPARPMIGGAATLALVALAGRDYLGLSLPLLDGALAGVDVEWWVPVLKLVFTVVALGSGFIGGEVTPLFVAGATLGSVLAGPLGLPAAALAGIGLVAVFSAAAHVPLTGAVMAAELFGGGLALPALLCCTVARRISGGAGIYADLHLTDHHQAHNVSGCPSEC